MNLEKLDEAIAYIEEHPERWGQRDWFYRGDGGCGTAACLAGTIALLDGWQPTSWCPKWDGGESSGSAVKDGVEDYVENIATAILGIRPAPGPDLHPLFEVENTLDDIKRVRDELAAGAL